ncbi:aldo/keto reductase [Puniceicoccales bacterium CK1056]|uniref:Aldo/keto reductase n=1 Tax=Oceanipulchritudo coccoides TaxID=2706888 RepID=A0A6B2M1H9_9BACT|nr:aldo/keto reductase [Oceanipulchritudo coccoides]NDV61937.1 aldo/keto reductase [Oceanipulchritudo coccoides]
MLPTLEFGRTGHTSSRLIFGACAFYDCTQDDADRTLDLVLEKGINHIDTAVGYNKSEGLMGPWLKHHRDQFFLATKTEIRTRREAKEELYQSLERLKTDHVDLWQMHCLIDPQEWETAMGPNGALEAFLEAREEGLVKYLGVTGHGIDAADMHLKSLERFDFDSVLLPYNYAQMQHPQYAAGFSKLEEICTDRKVAMQTIKSISRGPMGDQPKVYNMWYAPLDDQKAIDHAVHWVLGNPKVFLNTPADITLLPKVIEAAENFEDKTSDDIMERDMSAFGIEPLFS